MLTPSSRARTLGVDPDGEGEVDRGRDVDGSDTRLVCPAKPAGIQSYGHFRKKLELAQRVWSRPRDCPACRVGEWVITARRVTPSAVMVVSYAVSPSKRSASTTW